MDTRSILPVLFLKTKSSPRDTYEDRFAETVDGLAFESRFVPVLQHKFDQHGLAKTRELLREKAIGRSPGTKYGGLIFTSQRAVEAFSSLIGVGEGECRYLTPASTRSTNINTPKGGTKSSPILLESLEKVKANLEDVPVYSVGPATTRALKAVSAETTLHVFGEHTGNGDNLAQFILQHYGDWYRHVPKKPPLLFLVGEQRRDIIPKTLMAPDLPLEQRIQVDELVMYKTVDMESFHDNFKHALSQTENSPLRWVVVFSPSGCDDMLRGLGMLDEVTGKAARQQSRPETLIATIGPTTKSYLQKTFNFEPDLCSKDPSPDGVWIGITDLTRARMRKGSVPLEM